MALGEKQADLRNSLNSVLNVCQELKAQLDREGASLAEKGAVDLPNIYSDLSKMLQPAINILSIKASAVQDMERLS